MSVLVYRSSEIRDLSARRCWFTLESGWYDGVEVRGDDWVIPAKSGRTTGDRVDDLRVLRLHGFILGTDEANWKTVAGELEALFDPALTPGSLVVHTPYLGLAAGTRSINARTVTVRTNIVIANLVSEYDVTLHAIGSPPDWA